MKKLLFLVGALLLIGAGCGSSEIKSSYSEPAGTFERTDNPFETRDYVDEDEEVEDRDCADFSSQGEAQEFFEDQGGPGYDPHNLDRDGDGVVCETLN
jgi:micrococcal nuclease